MIGKLIKGRNASGLCGYLMGRRDHNGEQRSRADVIAGTFTGRTAAELTAEFGHLHDLRPKLGVHLAHVSLRVPEDERILDDAEWAEIGRAWAEGMRFEGYAVISHGDHVHIAASRIRLDGSVVADAHDWKRSEALIREIERTHGLRQVESSHLLEPERATTHRKALTMPQVALAERGIEPAGQVVARLIEATLASGATTASAYANALEQAGVVVVPNVSATTGRLSGFAYEWGGERVTASTLGRGFTLANLTKRGLEYVADRDREPLDRLSSQRPGRRLERPSGAPPEDAGRASNPTGGPDGREDGDSRGPGGLADAAGRGDGAVDRGNTADAQPDRAPVPAGPQGGGRRGRDLDGGGAGGRDEAGDLDAPGRAPDRTTPDGISGGRTERTSEPVGSGDHGSADPAGSGHVARLADGSSPVRPVEAPTAASTDEMAPSATLGTTPAVARLQAVAGVVPSGDRTLDQVRAQLRAFGCDDYEVQPIPPKGVETLRRERIRKWTAEQIENGLKWLKRMNAIGYDIFLRPAAPTDSTAQPFAFVDDVDQDVVKRMAVDGFPFAVLNESSPGRFHGWVRIAEAPLEREEVSRAGKLLAETYGADVNSADWRHYGRLAGTTNQKPSRATAKGAPFVMLRGSGGELAPGAEDLLAAARQSLENDAGAAARAASEAQGARSLQDGRTRPGDAVGSFQTARAAATPARYDDESARDFAGVLSLLRRGYNRAEVAAAVRQASPNLAKRHVDSEGYVEKTISRAEEIVLSTPSTPYQARQP